MFLRCDTFPDFDNYKGSFRFAKRRNYKEKRERRQQTIAIFGSPVEVRMDSSTSEKFVAALETFRIERPSRSFANTGTRFGKFIQPAAVTTTEEKGVLWDCPEGV